MEEARIQAAIQRVRAGDPSGLGAIYEAYARRVRGLCRRLLGSAEAAEDATTEVFLKVQQHMATYQSSRPFQSWILGIASNHCIDRLRRRGLERRIFDADALQHREPSSAAPGPLAECMAGERRRAVRRALRDLPDKYRAPLVMRFFAELSYDEIAEATGLSRNNVATLIFRAKKMLREVLEDTAKERTQ